MKISRTRVLWVLAIVFGAGALLWLVRRPGEVLVVGPVRRDIVEVVVASGKLQAVRETQVGAESAGIVESLAVNEGAIVRKGDLLGRLTAGETAARLAASRASLDVADKNLRAEEAALDKLPRVSREEGPFRRFTSQVYRTLVNPCEHLYYPAAATAARWNSEPCVC